MMTSRGVDVNISDLTRSNINLSLSEERVMESNIREMDYLCQRLQQSCAAAPDSTSADAFNGSAKLSILKVLHNLAGTCGQEQQKLNPKEANKLS